jgi:hypothetical protein
MFKKFSIKPSNYFSLFLISLVTFIFLIFEITYIFINKSLDQNKYFFYNLILICLGYVIFEIFYRESLKKKLIYNYFFNILFNYYFIIIISSLFLILIAYYFYLPSDTLDLTNAIFSSLLFLSNYFHAFRYAFNLGDFKEFAPLYNLSFLSLVLQLLLISPILFFVKKYKNIFYFLISFIFIISCKIYLSSFEVINLTKISFHTNFWLIIYGFFINVFIAKIKNSKINYLNEKFVNIFLLFFVLITLFFIIFYKWSIISINFYLLFFSFYLFYCYQKSSYLKFYIYKSFFLKNIYNIILFYIIFFPVFISFENFYGERLDLVKLFFLSLLISLFIITIISIFYKKILKLNISKKINLMFLSNLFIILILILINFIDGFRNNSIIQGVQLDNRLLFRDFKSDIKKFPVEKFPKSNKEKILIVGNSGGRNLYNIINSHKENISNIHLSILDSEIRCLINYIENTDCIIDFKKVAKMNTLYGIKDDRDTNIYNFLNANTIILSSRWTLGDIKSIQSILKNKEIKNKKIIIASNFIEFNLSKPWITLIDEKIFDNNDLDLNQNKIHIIKKNYFEKINEKRLLDNIKLKNLSKQYNLKYLNLDKLYCDFNLKLCEFFTPNKKKLFFDGYHLTRLGFQYMGKKINYLNLFKN